VCVVGVESGVCVRGWVSVCLEGASLSLFRARPVLPCGAIFSSSYLLLSSAPATRTNTFIRKIRRPSLILPKKEVDILDQEQEAEERALQGHFLPIVATVGDAHGRGGPVAAAAGGGGGGGGDGGYGTVGGGIASSL
jgi:hypothetical protein